MSSSEDQELEYDYKENLDEDESFISCEPSENPFEIKQPETTTTTKPTTKVNIINQDDIPLNIRIRLNNKVLNDEILKIPVNTTLNISCVLIGSENIVIQGGWKRITDDDNIIDLYDKVILVERPSPGTRSLNLMLANLSKKDQGKYECGVEDYSESSIFFNLVITGKQRIIVFLFFVE
jgi:hypothetical protein